MASIPAEHAEYGLLSSPTLPKPPPEHLNLHQLSPNDLADYFIKRISRAWAGTLVKQDLRHVPTDVGHLADSDQLVIYNPDKDCLYKFHVDQVPEDVVKKLEDLERAQEFGVGCFKQLHEVLKKRIQNHTMSEGSEEDYEKGVKGVVAMLSELSLQASSASAGPGHDMTNGLDDIKVHVVLVDGLGESHRYTHLLHTNTDLTSFLEEMDRKFSKFCDPYNEWAYKNWASRIQDLRDTGMDGDPALDRIEELIALHHATRDEGAPQWMYYTIRSKGMDGEEIDIWDEESLNAMISMAASRESPACLMRIAEAKFRNIFVELRFLEEKQLALTRSRDRARMKDENGDQSRPRPDDDIVDGVGAPFFDPESFYSLSYFYNLDHDNLNHFESQQHRNDN